MGKIKADKVSALTISNESPPTSLTFRIFINNNKSDQILPNPNYDETSPISDKIPPTWKT